MPKEIPPPATSPLASTGAPPTRVPYRGMGHLPGGWHPETKSTRHLFGAVSSVKGEARLDSWVDHVRDQRKTGSCTGRAHARVVHMVASIVASTTQPGLVIPYPSEMGLYAYGRMFDITDGSDLADTGARPGALLQAMTLWGIPSEIVWPDTDDVVNTRPDVATLEAAQSAQLTGYYLIDSDGGSRLVDCCVALDNQKPHTIAVKVDWAFNDYDGSKDIAVPSGEILGGHDIVILGYEGMPGKGARYRGVNSWGTGWGDKGFFWMTEAAVLAASDLAVVTATPYIGAIEAKKEV